MKHCCIVLRILIHVIPLVSFIGVSALARADSILHSDQRINIEYASTLGKTERQQTYVWLQQVYVVEPFWTDGCQI